MERINKYIIPGIVIAFLVLAVGWQYLISQKVLVKDQKPMRIVLTLDSMNENATNVALKSDYIYLGSSNNKVRVEGARVDNNTKQAVLVLVGEGIIYPDSAFFAGQRLVNNTKIRAHALFDAVSTVTKLEYIE